MIRSTDHKIPSRIAIEVFLDPSMRDREIKLFFSTYNDIPVEYNLRFEVSDRRYIIKPSDRRFVSQIAINIEGDSDGDTLVWKNYEYSPTEKVVIADLGDIPNEAKTVSDLRKRFLYKVSKQACGMKMFDLAVDSVENEKGVTGKEMFDEKVETKTSWISGTVDIPEGKYTRNNPKYRWKKGVNPLKDVKVVTKHIVPTKKVVFPARKVPIYLKTAILKGLMQSGKTNWIITRSIISVLNGRSSVIVLRETTGDHTQMLNRIDIQNKAFWDEVKKINKIFGELKGQGNDSEALVEVVQDVHKFVKDKSEVKRVFSGETPKLIPCISHSSVLKKLATQVQTIQNSEYDLFLDEADYVDSGVSEKTKQIKILKEYARYITFVSATILETACTQNVLADRVFILERPSTYKGVKNYQYPKIKGRIIFSDSKDADFFKLDVGLKDHLRMMKASVPYEFIKEPHPHIHLFRLGTAILPQLNAQEKTMKMFPGICTIVYNGNGIRFYSEHFTDKKITIKRGNKKITMKREGKFHTGNITMAEMLGFAQEQGVAKFPHIAIFSGKLAGRGISYVSNKMRNGVGWHITGLRCSASQGMYDNNILQLVGRLSGIFDDDIPLTLYVDDELRAAVRKAYAAQEELISRSCSYSRVNKISLKKALKKVPILSSKINNRKMSASVNPRTALKMVTKKSKEVGGWTWEKKFSSSDLYKKEEKKEIKEDVKEEKDGKICLVNVQIAGVYKLIYDKTISSVLDSWGTGVWVKRSLVVAQMIRDGIDKSNDSIRASLKDFGLKPTKHTKISDINADGLLLKKHGSLWYIRVN